MAEKEYIEREAFLEQKRRQYCEDCSRRKGMKNGKYKTLYEIGEAPCRACGIDDVLNDVEDFPAADVVERASGIIGVIPAADVRPVITCGECKHWFENGTDYCSCDRDALLRERDFFCAAGEKREES